MERLAKTIPIYTLLLMFFSSCGSGTGNHIPGGPCTYSSTPGTAIIISLSSASLNSNNCANNPVEVLFDFTPDSPADANDATDKNQHVIVGDGKNPPLDYVINKGLTIGSSHPCTRQNITSGTCSPVSFIFGDVDLSDFAASCF